MVPRIPVRRVEDGRRRERRNTTTSFGCALHMGAVDQTVEETEM
jgi:hypothetical protein